ncbi:hypothetical protein BLA29_000068 [Euroglyphus maynei]|uniref:Gustatory receptor n=1 Tax=Euroglyphus maynei TaxID=6958 RepID=A0A1Y3AWK6_EURMA|nr:hypothetical protein BLA29_000068 [Euroglyphus maynei]
MFEKLIEIRHFYYNRLNEIFIERNTDRLRKKHQYIILLLSITIVRILTCMISYYSDTLNIWYYDTLFNFFIFDHPHLFQRYSIILLCALLFGIECERKFFFTSINTITFQFPYELSVTNTDQCKQCMISEKDEQLLLNNIQTKSLNKTIIIDGLYRWYRLQMNKLDYYFNFKYVDQQKLSHYKLQTMPNITMKSRSLLMIINFLIEQICYLSYISLGRLFQSRFLIHLIIWMDLFLMLAYFLVILHNALTLIFMVSTTIIYQLYLLRKINSSLRSLSVQSHRIEHHFENGLYRTSFNLNEQITLHQLLNEHGRIIYYINYSSRDIFSNLFFRILILFITSHILGVSALWNRLGFWYDQILISSIIFFEDFLLFPLYFIAIQCKHLHRSEKILTSIIYGIRRPLSLKIKYDHFFQRLTTQPYYGHSISNIGTITFRTLFNVRKLLFMIH